MNPLVLRLDDPRARDPLLVGPKAAHLSALAGRYPVPGGFCLTADAYRHAERQGGLDPDLSAAIVAAYEELTGGEPLPPPLAVRSSALDEDGPAASFAGQHETILGVTGLDALLAAIERTWASLHAEAALAYRRDHGLPLEGLALAVLVQRLVIADAAGVAFSVDPVSGRRDRIVVNATWGLGESLVAGHVTPDRWNVDKADLKPVESRVANKARMTVLLADGARGTDVPAFLRERPALAKDELRAVAALARDLERDQGWPVDAEFALAGGQLHLLQCRPVTALPEPAAGAIAAPDDPLGGLPAPWQEPADATRHWKRDRMHFPGQITLLDLELMRLAVAEGLAHGARTYGIPATTSVRRFWSYYYDSVRRLPVPEDEREIWRARGADANAEIEAGFENVWAWRWRPEIEAHLAFWDAFDLAGADDAALLAHLDATHERLARVWQVHFEIVIPMARARDDFLVLYRELFEGTTELDAAGLLQGQETLTTRAGAALWALRDAVDGVPGLAAEITSLAPDGVLATLEARPDAVGVRQALDAYLADYGRRTLYLALTAPSLQEDPTPVVTMLQDALRRPEQDARVRHAEVAMERERRVAAARERLGGYPAPVRTEFERCLATAQFSCRLDEDHAFLIDYGTSAAVRRVVLEVGRRIAGAGGIVARDDVFHLTWDEMRATLAALPTIDRRDLVAERRDEMRRFADIDPPETLGTPPADAPATGNTFQGRPPPETREPDVVTGNPGSRGFVRGRARVLRDLNDAGELRPGEVLVATTTSQPWTPLFGIAAGLVTDTGGVLSHTAVVAREYGLPAVVGTRVATRRIRDGMLLEVDGDRGLVRIIGEG